MAEQNPPFEKFSRPYDTEVSPIEESALTAEDDAWDLTPEDIEQIVRDGFDDYQAALEKARRRDTQN